MVTDWIEQHYREQRQKLDQKGGPGSGHWGHAGRPGKRGGSAPGKMRGGGRVNREYFTKGPGRRMVQFLNDAEQENVIEVITEMKVQPKYLADLTSITHTLEPDIADCPNWRDCWMGGYYKQSDRTIHMDPDMLVGGVWEHPDFSGKLHTKGKAMLSHELGHHITLKSSWTESKAAEILYNQYFYKVAPGGWSFEYEAMGLRKYSLKNVKEFKADCWMVYQYGSEKQKAALAKSLSWSGIESLDDIFGRES